MRLYKMLQKINSLVPRVTNYRLNIPNLKIQNPNTLKSEMFEHRCNAASGKFRP